MDLRINHITLNINERNADINTAEIPSITVRTKAIFKELGTDASDYLVYPLRKKADALINTIQKLENAKKHKTKEIIFCLLRSALTAAIVAGGILGTMALAWYPPAALGIAFLAVIAYSALSYYNAYRADIMEIASTEYIGPLFVLITSPFLPIYEGFSKTFRIEKDILKQKKEIEHNFSELIFFFKHDRSELRNKLEDEIEKLKQSLKMLDQFPIKAGRKEIEDKLRKYEWALEDFRRAKFYFSQFKF